MAEVKGMMLICDRCSNSVFLKTIGDGEADGGYTRWNKFEDPPEGWGSVCIPTKNKIDYTHIRVCPSCRKQWMKVVNEGFCCGTEYYIDKQKEEEVWSIR